MVKCELSQFAIGPVCESLYFYQHSFVAASPDLFDVIVGDHLKPKAAPLNLDESGTNLDAQSDRRWGNVLYVKRCPD